MTRLILEAEIDPSDDEICDRLSVRELARLSMIDWTRQIDRRSERLSKLTFLTEDMTK